MVDKINPQQMAANYGFALAFLNSSPELKHLFNTAVAKTWDTNMFVARLRNTKWFKAHSAAVRNAIIQQTSDPATYKRNVQQMAAQVSDAFGKAYGQSATSLLGASQLHAWAETAFRMGWSQEELMDHMGASINFMKALTANKLGGTAAEMSHNMDQIAAQFGVEVGNNFKAPALKRLLTGGDTEGAIEDRIKDLAAAKYAAFAEQIKSGKTVQELADPYVQQMSQLLEIDPGTVNVARNASIQKALLGTKDKKSGQVTAMNLSDFSDMIRRDPRWQHTDNAKAQVADVTSQLLRGFGFM